MNAFLSRSGAAVALLILSACVPTVEKEHAAAYVPTYSIPEWTKRTSTRLKVNLDLRRVRKVELEVYCEDPSAIQGCTCYFTCKGGNYSVPFHVTRSGWSTVQVDRTGVKTVEGHPDGWGRIESVLVSFWNCGVASTRCEAKSCRIVPEPDPRAVIVMQEKNADQFDWRHRLAVSFDAIGIPFVVVSSADLTADLIGKVDFVAIPGRPTPKLPDAAEKAVADFRARGGVVFTKQWKGLIPGEDVEVFGKLMAKAVPTWSATIDAAAKRRTTAEASARLALKDRLGRTGERRRICCHFAGGFEGAGSWIVADDMGRWTWDRTAGELKARGITDIEVNFCRAGTAWYRSNVLPMATDLDKTGDRLEQALAACRKHGLKLRAWRVCWNVGEKNLQTAECAAWMSNGLAQVSHTGKTDGRFLCPTAPENCRREVEAMVELASRGVDSVAFDYIRYPDRQHCFCDRCRAAFEAQFGAVTNWPAEVRNEGVRGRQWTQFRHRTISGVVRDAAERIHREHPGVEVCAAVMGDADGLYKDLGQPWGEWVRAGWLDRVAPMDYVDDPERLRQMIRRQKASVPVEKLEPTIGPSLWVDDGLNFENLVRQIDVLRDEGVTGFGIFQLDYRTMKYPRVDE